MSPLTPFASLHNLEVAVRYDFHGRMRTLFESEVNCVCLCGSPLNVRRAAENRNLTDEDEIENALKLGEYIKKGIHSRS